MTNTKLLSMQKFAQMCRVTPRTLRFYQKLGLIQPVKIDEFTKYRYFDPLQAREVFQIKLLQSFHLPLKEIKELLGTQTAQIFLDGKVQEVALEIEEKKKQLAVLEEVNHFIVQEKDTSQFLATEEIGPLSLLCTFYAHGRYDALDEYAKVLFEKAKNLQIPVTGEYIVFYRDPLHYRPNDSPMEVGIVLDPSCHSGEKQSSDSRIRRLDAGQASMTGVYLKEFPAQKVLTYTYQGPFEYLTFIHKRMVALTRGKKLQGYPFDLYLHGPWDKKSPYDYLTKVGYPVQG